MPLFQNSVVTKYLQAQKREKLAVQWNVFKSHFLNPVIQENIRQSKEEQYQGEFLIDLFVKVLGYTKNPEPNYNLTTEYKNIKDSKKADGAILLQQGVSTPCKKETGDAQKHETEAPCVVGVIELKGTNTTDLGKIETQAFGYKNNQPDCIYVITSNFEKLRFYIDNAIEHIEFNLFALTEKEFQLLWLCLAFENIEKGIAKKIKDESVGKEEEITKKLYKDYSLFKRELHQNLVALNAGYEPLELFKKSQKLLDRLLFLFFAEDRQLLPPNSVRLVLNDWKDLRERDVDIPLYDRFRKYFEYLNTGFKGKRYDVYAYNGGLFKPDAVLDAVKIDNDLLYRHTLKLSEYDFVSEVDVNILGHIFENSLNELDEIKAQLEGKEIDKSKTKRKKDGVFYTPKYITKYIVDNTVGKLCREKKAALQINEEAYTATRGFSPLPKKEKQNQLDKLTEYRSWLLQLTICDPACGSGAFLNQALDFLIREHRYIDELQAKLFGDALVLSDIENSILENNLFGVDLNEESVEIARLSLWLRTAQPNRKLNDLNNNIKCGNSLIDDPAVAGDKAFNWQKEFPKVFEEKNKKIWHVTTVMHDTRTSQRMIDYKVRERRADGEMHVDRSIFLNDEESLKLTEIISNIIIENKFNCLAYNVCGDHVHLILVCEEEELPEIVRKLKGKSAQKFKEYKGIPKEDTFHLWAQKFNSKEITGDEQLSSTINYIATNREKHQLPDINKGMQPLVEKMTCTLEHAFQTEYKGGFDVVIGNPPYVRADSPGNTLAFREYLVKSKRYETLAGKWDLYIPFIEQSIKLANTKGKISLIIPDAYCHAEYTVKSLQWIKEKRYLSQIDYFPEFLVFENVGVRSVIVNCQKNQSSEFIQRIHYSANNFSEIVLESYPESLRLDSKKSILNKKLSFYLLNQICYLTVGIVGNSDEKKFQGEFEVGDLLSDIKDQTHPKLYFEGKDIGKWILLNKRWIEYGTDRSPSKWRRKGFTKLFEGSHKLVAMRSPGYIPRVMLDENDGYFNESAIGFKRWIDLKGVENNSLKKSYNNDIEREEFERISLAYSYFFLLALLNSKLMKYELNTNRRSNIHIYPEDWKVLKIPQINNDNIPIAFELEKKADQMLSLNRELQLLAQKFQRTLLRRLETMGCSPLFDSLPKKLEEWYLLSYGDFIKELGKKKIKLSLSDEAEWEAYFTQEATKALELKAKIDATDKEIDQMVYELYGLTEEEIRIMEQ